MTLAPASFPGFVRDHGGDTIPLVRHVDLALRQLRQIVSNPRVVSPLSACTARGELP